MAKSIAQVPVVEVIPEDVPAPDATEAEDAALVGEIVDDGPDPVLATRLAEQEGIVFSDIHSWMLRTQEVQQRVGRALNVIRANELWRAARDENQNGFKSFSQYLLHIGEVTDYSRTNYLRMMKDDVAGYLESGEAPEGFEAPQSRGGASGVKYTNIHDAADVTLRQIDGLFERWGQRAEKVQSDVDGETVFDMTLFNLLTAAQAALADVRAELTTLSAVE